jgi:carbonic anhydrase
VQEHATTRDATRALGAPLSRRLFAARAVRWSLAGTVGLIAAACGSGVTKQELSALEDELRSLEMEVRRLKGDTGALVPPSADGHAAASPPADPHAAPASGAPSSASNHGSEPAHWTYEGASGPSEWASLSPENAVCGSGSTQSPIDISFTQSVSGGRTVLHWDPGAPLSLEHNGHTIQANLEPGSRIEVDGTPYELLQFHFHAPSEHTIEGKQMAMETHFVHRSEKGDLAVIGVLHALGAENAALAPLWGELPRSEGDRRAVPSFDLLSVLPRERQMFRYAGSLTTPPCTEGVRWHVMQSPTTVSQQQVAAFLELFKGGNSRPVQPLKARDILHEVA